MCTDLCGYVANMHMARVWMCVCARACVKMDALRGTSLCQAFFALHTSAQMPRVLAHNPIQASLCASIPVTFSLDAPV